MSSLIVYLLCLWRHNAHKSILRRLRNVCSLPGLVRYCRTERGERFDTVFEHRSQAKSFKHRIRPRAGFLPPDIIASHSGNDAEFSPSLLLILCSIHVLCYFQDIGYTVLYCADSLPQDHRHNMISLCPVLNAGSITEKEFALGYSVHLCPAGLSCCWNCTSFKDLLCGIDLSTTLIRNFQIFEVWIMRNRESETNQKKENALNRFSLVLKYILPASIAPFLITVFCDKNLYCEWG